MDLEDRIRAYIAPLSDEEYGKVTLKSLTEALQKDDAEVTLKQVKSCIFGVGLRALREAEEEDDIEAALVSYSESIGHTTFTVRDACRSLSHGRSDVNAVIYHSDCFTQVDTGTPGTHWQHVERGGS